MMKLKFTERKWNKMLLEFKVFLKKKNNSNNNNNNRKNNQVNNKNKMRKTNNKWNLLKRMCSKMKSFQELWLERFKFKKL